MLRFSTHQTIDGLNHLSNGNCDLQFVARRNPYIGGWEISEYMYGELIEQKQFDKLADAKKWANTQNAYLDGI